MPIGAWDELEFQHAGLGAGNSNPVPGTDRSGGCDRSCERGQGGWADLVGSGASLVPYYVVSGGVTTMVQPVSSHMGWGLALAGISGDVRNPPFVQVVSWTDGAKSQPDLWSKPSVQGRKSTAEVNSAKGGAATAGRTRHRVLEFANDHGVRGGRTRILSALFHPALRFGL